MHEIKKGTNKFLTTLTALTMALSYIITPISAYADTKDLNKSTGGICVEGGTVKLIAKDENNKPVADVTYTLKNSDGTVIESKTTVDNGFVYFTLKGTEKYQVTGNVNGLKYDTKNTTKDVQLTAGVYSQQDIELTENYNISKRNVKVTTKYVNNSVETAQENIPFTLKDTEGRTIKEGKTDNTGVFEVKDVPSGEYELIMGKIVSDKGTELQMFEKGSSTVITTFKKQISINKNASNFEYNLESKSHQVSHTTTISKIDQNGAIETVAIPFKTIVKDKSTGDVVSIIDSTNNKTTYNIGKYGQYTFEIVIPESVALDYTLTKKGTPITLAEEPKLTTQTYDTSSVNTLQEYVLRRDSRTLTLTPKIKRLDGTLVGVKDGQKLLSEAKFDSKSTPITNGVYSIGGMGSKDMLTINMSPTKIIGTDGITYNIGQKSATETNGITFAPMGVVLLASMQENIVQDYILEGTPEDYGTAKFSVGLYNHNREQIYEGSTLKKLASTKLEREINFERDIGLKFKILLTNITTGESIAITEKNNNYLVNNFVKLPKGTYKVELENKSIVAEYNDTLQGTYYKDPTTRTPTRGVTFNKIQLTPENTIRLDNITVGNSVSKLSHMLYKTVDLTTVGQREYRYKYPELRTTFSTRNIRGESMTVPVEFISGTVGDEFRNTSGITNISMDVEGLLYNTRGYGRYSLFVDRSKSYQQEFSQSDIKTLFGDSKMISKLITPTRVYLDKFIPELYEYRLDGVKLEFEGNTNNLTSQSHAYVVKKFADNSYAYNSSYFTNDPELDMFANVKAELSFEIIDLYKGINHPEERTTVRDYYSVKETHVEIYEKKLENGALTKVEANPNKTNNFYTSEQGVFGTTDRVTGYSTETTETTTIIPVLEKVMTPNTKVNLYDAIQNELNGANSQYYSFLETYLYNNTPLQNGKTPNSYDTVLVENQYKIDGEYVTVNKATHTVLNKPTMWIDLEQNTNDQRYSSIYAYKDRYKALQNPLENRILLTFTTTPEVIPPVEPEPTEQNYYLSTQIIPNVYRETKEGDYVREDERTANEIARNLEFTVGTQQAKVNNIILNTVTSLTKNPILSTQFTLTNPNTDWVYELDGEPLEPLTNYSYKKAQQYTAITGTAKQLQLTIQIGYNKNGGESGIEIVKPIVDMSDCNSEPIITTSTDNPTNADIDVSIKYSDLATRKEYKLGKDGSWVTYTAPFKVQENTTIYASSYVSDNVETKVANKEITNIDKILPTLEINPNKTAPTNTDVTLEVIGEDNVSVKHIYWIEGKKVEKEVLENGTLLTGTTIVVDRNKTITIVIEDKAGNKVLKEITISNIDKEAPVKPTITLDTEEMVHTGVHVTIDYPTDSTKNYYKIDDGDWKLYTDVIEISNNSMIYAKAEDNAGNISEITTKEIINIDKTVPTAPTIKLSKETPTNENVLVTIEAETKNTIFYKEGSASTWTKYTTPFEVEENTLITSKSVSKSGLDSLEIEKEITNIDKIKPVITLSPYNIGLVNGEVTVNGNITDNVGIKTMKILGGKHTLEAVLQSGLDTTEKFAIVTSKNIAMTVAVEDTSGNTALVVVDITNIDNDKPTIEATIPTGITNKDVEVPVKATDMNGIKDFKYMLGDEPLEKVLKDGKDLATEDKIVFAENGKATLVAKDNVGNTEIKVIEISNIDKVKPTILANVDNAPTNKDVELSVKATDNTSIEHFKYMLGEETEDKVLKEGKLLATEDVINIPANTKITLVAIDIAGNTEIKVLEISGIDKVSPTIEAVLSNTKPTNKNVEVTVIATDNVKLAQFKYLKGNKTEEEVLKDGKDITTPTNITFEENGEITLVTVDTAGNVARKVVVVSNISTEKPIIKTTLSTEKPTNKDVTLTIEVTDKIGIKEVKYLERKATEEEVLATGTTISATDTIIVPRNKTITLVAVNEADTITLKEVEVSNIDRISPEITAKLIKTHYPIYSVLVDFDISDNVAIKEVKYLEGNNSSETVSMLGEILEHPYQMTLLENKMMTVVVIDTAGNTREILVNSGERDSVNPVLDITLSTEAETNKNVKLKVVATDNTGIKEVKYLEGNKTLQEVSDSGTVLRIPDEITVTENKEITIVAYDVAGNTTLKVVKITNINKDKIVEPIINVSDKKPTLSDLVITIDYPINSVKNEYKIGTDGDWVEYVGDFIINKNTTIYAKSTDKFGVDSDIVVEEITNIITENNSVTKIKADITVPTNQDVTITIESNLVAGKIIYTENGTDWSEYKNPFKVSENKTITARTEDSKGTLSSTEIYNISNIDKVKPELELVLSNDKPTNQTILLTAIATDNVKVDSLYIIEGKHNVADTLSLGKFIQNGDVIEVTHNIVYTVVVKDTANNHTLKTISITNIDKDLPATPTIKADKTELTNEDVKITIDYPTKADKKYYSIDGSDWKEYTEPIIVENNAVITAYGIDNLGNKSEEASYRIENIDKELPELGITLSTEKLTNQDITICLEGKDNRNVSKILYVKGKNKATLEEVLAKGEEYKDCIVVSKNNVYSFVIIDTAGNKFLATKEITSISKKAVKTPTIIFTDKKDDVKGCSYVATIKYPTDSVVNEYKLAGEEEWALYTKPFKVACNTAISTRATNEYGTVSTTEIKISPTASSKDPITKPITKPVVKPVVKPITKPVIEPVIKPVIEEPVIEQPKAKLEEKVEELPKTGTEESNKLWYGLTVLILGSYVIQLARRKKTEQ